MIKLLVDSTAEINLQEAKELGIILVPMRVLIDDEEYLVGVNLSKEQFYEKLSSCKTLPKTSQIIEEEYYDAIKEAVDGGDEVFAMCFSSGISGSFNNLEKASEKFSKDKVEILDTETTTFAYKALVMEALKMIKNGASLKELKREISLLKDKVKLYAVIDNVKYLIKGGRLSLAKGMTATALNIKPIVTIKNKVEVVTKAIGFGFGIKTLCKLVQNIDRDKDIYFGHSNDLNKLEKLRNLATTELGIVSDNICDLGPVIATHVGPGCVGIVYFEK